MSKEQRKRKVYGGLNIIFWLISAALFLLFLTLVYIYYISKKRNNVTFTNLFLVGFVLSVSMTSALLGSYFHFLKVYFSQVRKKPNSAKKQGKIPSNKRR